MGVILIIVSVLGSLASIIGFGIALIQTKKLRALELENNRKTWSQISTVKGIMEDLEHNDPQQAIGKVFEQFRYLLKEAVMQEQNFSVVTIKKWRKVGKLSSMWQEHQAFQLMQTNELKEEDIEQIAAEHAAWNEDPNNENPYDYHSNRLKKWREKKEESDDNDRFS